MDYVVGVAMEVLVAGFGSIGRRHVNNLLNLEDIDRISIYTKVKDFGDLNKDKIEIINSLNGVDVDFAIIANETHRHLATAIPLAERGIHLFIEKPLTHNLRDVRVLKEIVERKKVKVFVGYNLRFLGAMMCIKEQLSKRIIGDLYFAKIEVGQYLPLWRPDSDYRYSYSANSDRGGGVALDLSHEVDYMRYLFGDPYCWKVARSKVSKLEIDSEDIFEAVYKYQNGFICNVHMDYLQQDKKREIRIVGSEGTLICDFINKTLRVNKDSVIKDESIFDINKTYIDELTHFIESIEQNIEPRVTLEDGIKVLKLLEDGSV